MVITPFFHLRRFSSEQLGCCPISFYLARRSFLLFIWSFFIPEQCLFQLRSLSSHISKYFTSFFNSILLPPKETLDPLQFFFLGIHQPSVLEALYFMFFLFAHSMHSSNILSHLPSISFMVFPFIMITWPSAYTINSQPSHSFTSLNHLSIRVSHRYGPRLDPCGHPFSMSQQ